MYKDILAFCEGFYLTKCRHVLFVNFGELLEWLLRATSLQIDDFCKGISDGWLV